MSKQTSHNARTAESGQSERPDPNALYAIAEDQAGYFTARQAQTAGYSRALVSHHAGAGKFERVERGVYRLTRFPGTPNEDLYVAWLRAGPNAVVSHDSALALLGLSDLLPSEIHLTVPRTASRRRKHVRLHTSELGPEDITSRDGLAITTPARTIADVAGAGLSDELVRQAIREAMEQGAATAAELRRQTPRLGRRVRHLIESALSESNI